MQPIGKYCSEKCMKKDNGFSDNGSSEAVKDLLVQKELLLLDKSSISLDKKIIKKAADKFQSSMVKDAIRLEYAFKRESYKREMRQPSLRKASLSDKKESKTVSVESSVSICKGKTKKGVRCTNKAIGNSDYCGILSHAMTGV
jgi:hypothetical protein